MVIVKTKSGFVLKRYGGQVDGKNIEVRVGVIPLSATASSIDETLKRDLTPNELDHVIKYLNDRTAEAIRSKVETLANELNEIGTAVSAEIVDASSVERIKNAARAFLELLDPSIFASKKPARVKGKQATLVDVKPVDAPA